MLLKAGVVMMAVALFCAAVVCFVILRNQPERAVASETVAAEGAAPLARSYPPEVPREKPETQPPSAEASDGGRAASWEPLPVDQASWPEPTEEQLEAANKPRDYELPRGAIMALTIDSIGLHNVPVLNKGGEWSLNNGVAHQRGTSMPWSRSKQRNVYIAGHRLGWPGTESHLVFYHLDKLAGGDEIVLKDRDGKRYVYRVSEIFEVEPDDSWVMGKVKGRDMLTLQTCTPIPTWEKRLIVRADRV
jgi:sortase A